MGHKTGPPAPLDLPLNQRGPSAWIPPMAPHFNDSIPLFPNTFPQDSSWIHFRVLNWIHPPTRAAKATLQAVPEGPNRI